MTLINALPKLPIYQERSFKFIALNHRIITITPTVGIIIATPDTVISVAKNILKIGIPPKRALLMGGEEKDRAQTDSTITKKRS